MILKRTLRHVFQFFLGEVCFSKENALQISPKFLLHRRAADFTKYLIGYTLSDTDREEGEKPAY